MIKKQQKGRYLCRNTNLKVRFIALYRRSLRLNWTECFKCFYTMMLTSKVHYFKKYLIKQTIKCLDVSIISEEVINYQDYQKQPLEVFRKKSVLKSFANFTGKHLCWSPFLFLGALFFYFIPLWSCFWVVPACSELFLVVPVSSCLLQHVPGHLPFQTTTLQNALTCKFVKKEAEGLQLT